MKPLLSDYLKRVTKALLLFGAVVAIGYPFFGQPAEWVGLILFAGAMGD